MSIGRSLKEQFDSFDDESADRIIRMAWEDRTSYTAITIQFGLSPSRLVAFMRYKLDANGFRRWRRRVFEQGKLKNKTPEGYRFKCKSQRLDGSTKNHK
jgi:uncharacterized protein (TIGR03643 family)